MICFVYRGQLMQLHVCLHRATQVLATGVVEYFVLFLVTEKLRSGKRDCNTGQVRPMSGTRFEVSNQSRLSFKKCYCALLIQNSFKSRPDQPRIRSLQTGTIQEKQHQAIHSEAVKSKFSLFMCFPEPNRQMD